MAVDWLTVGLAAGNVVTAAGGVWLGRRGRAAVEEADAADSLSTTVVRLGQRLDLVSQQLWDAQQRLNLAEARAGAAEARAAAAELRASTSEADLVALRAEVAELRRRLADYEGAAAA